MVVLNGSHVAIHRRSRAWSASGIAYSHGGLDSTQVHLDAERKAMDMTRGRAT